MAHKKKTIVVTCSTSYPVYFLLGIYNILTRAGIKVNTSCHTHSSINNLPFPEHCQSFLPLTQSNDAKVCITLIWKEIGHDCQMMVSPQQTPIVGEVNMLRYFTQLFWTLVWHMLKWHKNSKKSHFFGS